MSDSLATRLANAHSDIARIKAEHRALAILRFLHREPSYGSNERIVAAYLELLAIGGGCNEIRSALDDLERLGLLRAERRAGLMVVWLTQSGEDAALGRSNVEGVLPPAPDEPY
jgi:hypothetical protein